MKTVQMRNSQGYPMYFKVKDTVIEKLETQQVRSERKISIGTTEELFVGDKLLFGNQEHDILEVSAPRPCKGNHTVDGVLFQEVKTSFVDNL